MNTKILAYLLLSLSALSGFGQTEVSDTLMTASSASSLRIKTDNSGISIVVKNLDGNGENFYYSTSKSKAGYSNETTETIFRDVRNVIVMEIGSEKLEISFDNSSSSPNVLSYEIPDPENRTVNSYIGENYWSFGINLSKNKHKGYRGQWKLITTGLGLGWVTPLNAPQEMNTSMGRSMEWTWAVVLGTRWSYGRHSITAGLGLDWRNYTMNSNRYFHKEDDGTISIHQFDEGIKDGRSRLLTFSLQVPILYDIRFGHRKYFGFSAGPIINFNTGASINTKYKLGDNKYTVKTGKIGQSPVTVDVMGIIHYRAIGLYARYAPMNVLRTQANLDFQSFSTGIMLTI